MIIEIIDKDLKIKEINSNKTIIENESNKNNDISTTKEDESFITDEIIQYCSSPKRGLVSINISKNNNEKITPVPPEENMIPEITNTITMSIAMIKKEIDIKDIDKIKKRRCTYNKDDENENENHYKNKENCHFDKLLIRETNKDNKCKSNFKDKKKEREFLFTDINRRNLELNIDINKEPIRKKTSKKKKKNKKSKEQLEENKNKERDEKRKLSVGEENDNKKKKKKKKKNKKLMSKKKVKEGLNEENKGDEIENDNKDHSPNIIILDFTSSENNIDDSDDSDKNKNSENNGKSIDEKENLNKNNRKLLRGNGNENEFFNKRQKTIIIKNSDELKKGLLLEKKIITPKSKQSCCLNSPYKICQTKTNIKSSSRKISSKNVEEVNKTKIKAKSKSICPITQKKTGNKDLNKERDSHKLLKIFSKKINSKNIVEDRPIKIRHSISKNFTNSQPPEKLKARIKEKDSIQSCKILNKHNEIIPTNNIENEKNKKNKEDNKKESKSKEKYKSKTNYQNKSNKNLAIKNLNKTPQTKLEQKNAYNSNRNLTKIAINPKTAEQKDIHLVFEGKQETIINYTNQEMVDDENEYMVECLKVLLKLKMEEQPRCKQKVNFNFPIEEKNKKIALFDLDETLVHCTKDKKGLNGDVVNIKLPTNKTVPVGLNIRSHWKEALDLIKSHYHIVVYTASHQSYADAVLNYLDKENKYFQYRLYRNHCVQCDVDGIKFYVKDLDTLNKFYNLKDVVLIDNSVLSFAYHLNNGIPIVPFIEQKDDTQLLMLAYYLVSIANYDDLRQENKKHVNIENYLLMAKKLSEEESEEDDDDNEEEKKDIVEDNNQSKNKDINKEDENKNNEAINNNDLSKEKSKIENDESSLDRSKVENNKKFLHFKKSNKTVMKKSEKALKIAEDMKKSLGEVYKSKNNYN